MSEQGRNGVATFVPGLLYQRGQFLSWPAGQKRRWLEQLNIRVVWNLWHKTDPDFSGWEGGSYIHTWMPGDRVPEAWPVWRDIGLSLLRNRTAILVHCEAGVNRSVWLASALAALYQNLSGTEVLMAAGAARRVKVHANFRAHLASISPAGITPEQRAGHYQRLALDTGVALAQSRDNRGEERWP